MKPGRIAIVVAAVLGSCLLVLALLLPLEDETCPQVYRDLYGRHPGSSLGRTTPWDCFEAIATVRRKERAVERAEAEDRKREPQRQAERERLAALAKLEAEKLELAKHREAVGQTEAGAALAAQFREALCPRFKENLDRQATLTLFASKAGALVYSHEFDCPGCQYLVEPGYTLQNLDGSIFCRGGPQGSECETKLPKTQVRLRVTRFGTPQILRAWLGCPN
jgi:hypothetical protein